MKTSRNDINPFDLTKASDFSDTEILNYWVDLVESYDKDIDAQNSRSGLLNIIKPTLLMPMLLLGGKGSGKTHLMRFCSAPVQSMRHDGNLNKAVTVEGYLGVYLQSESLNTGRFQGKGQSEETWNIIFSYSFELWLALSLIKILRNLIKSSSVQINEQELMKNISSLFDADIGRILLSFDDFENFLLEERKKINFAVNNCALTRRLEGISILFSPGKLAFGIPAEVAKFIPLLDKSIIVYLIDEVENFTEEQQKFLNTLIRYRSGNVSIKLGCRLYGIKTYKTIGSGEPIKSGSEFEEVKLDSLLREAGSKEITNDDDISFSYLQLARKLVHKRIVQSQLMSNIGTFDEVDNLFDEIKKDKAFQEFSISILKKRDENKSERPCIDRLRKILLSEFTEKNKSEIEEIISNIRRVDHPLLEKLNVFLLYKNWTRLDDLVLASKKIGTSSKEYSSFLDKTITDQSDECKKYAQSFAHFGNDMLAQLQRECGIRNKYAGFECLVNLSQGIPRNLLGLLKNIYRNALFNGEQPFCGKPISIDAQTAGIRDGADWFWDDAQPDNRGPIVREAVDALAVFFRDIRYSDKPSECDLVSFSVDFDALSDEAKLAITMSENWSYLIKIKGGQKNKNSNKVDSKYQLSPMLVPRWGLSPQRGGTIELQTELANVIFDQKLKEDRKNILSLRVKDMDFQKSAPSQGEQRSLFSE